MKIKYEIREWGTKGRKNGKKDILWENKGRKPNQAIHAFKRASELMNLVSCGLWPEENEQFR